MIKKNIKELSNSELNHYKMDLVNEYESIKAKIDKLCNDLEIIEKEYKKTELELTIRGNNIY